MGLEARIGAGGAREARLAGAKIPFASRRGHQRQRLDRGDRTRGALATWTSRRPLHLAASQRFSRAGPSRRRMDPRGRGGRARASEIRERLFESGVELTFFELITVLAFLYFARDSGRCGGHRSRARRPSRCHQRAHAARDGRDHDRLRPRALPRDDDRFDRRREGGDLQAWRPGDRRPHGSTKRRRCSRASPRHSHARIVSTAVNSARRLRRRDSTTTGDARSAISEWALAGRFQIDNAAVALAALEEGGWLGGIGDETIRTAVGTVRWPGRLEVIRERPRVVLDGAHNPAGVAALVGELARLAGAGPCISCSACSPTSAGRRWSNGWLRRSSTSPWSRSSRGARRVPPAWQSSFVGSCRPGSSAKRDDRYRTTARGSGAIADDVILVAGSLFLVGEARAHLGDPKPATRSFASLRPWSPNFPRPELRGTTRARRRG